MGCWLFWARSGSLAIATITKAAAYHRVLFQVINEKCSTVAHFHSSLPKAAVVFPVKANCSGNFSFRWVFWMRTPQPAGSVRPAMLDGNTFISHHGACFASKAIPSLWYIQNVHVTFSSSGPVKPLSAARPPEGNVVTRQTWILSLLFSFTLAYFITRHLSSSISGSIPAIP